MTDAVGFGLELRRARECRGLTLDQLAEATKISASLFAGLERGDLSRWPNGIFRRAFVRSYAEAVGLDAEATLARFVRLHPDAEEFAAGPERGAGEAEASTTEAETPGDAAPVASVAAPGAKGGAPTVARRLGAPAIDLLAAGIPAVAVSVAFGWQWFWLTGAGIAVFGHVLALALVGATPGAWLVLPRTPVNPPSEADVPARRRPEPDIPTATPPPRRHQARHASGARAAASRVRRARH